ncbi:hypothetical protein [Yeosuana sp. AK3]|nr:hypothetical protein [Flavobacteriia bacterium]NCP06450.1 hypothetical protein [Flavobacteriales bacterium]PIY13374.1 MAG: hypothetical protein COZ17_00645 [Flavobacteriaceae bacterium CG_4_10_14_3_um_filter_33_47]PJB20670.1 MAG: hypothetical protein CO117_00130 [Flavobacteriaceae bacterium CG_4_9_14_3_um_filter_33_16]NCP51142.1 hypothetical protein [Flavobacteriales bacterium]
MKSLNLLLSVALFTVCFHSLAQESVENESQTGKICFIRSTGFAGSAAAFKTFIDDEFVCKLNNKRYSFHEVSVGKHFCSVQFGSKKSKEKAEKFEIEVKPGGITYVQLVFETGVLINNVYCEEVTENTAKSKMENLTEDVKCL